MRAKLRRTDLNGARLIEIAHVRYDDGFGYMYRAEQWPRLVALDRHWPNGNEAGEKTVRYWLVDGQVVADLDEALERLNIPPILTPEEAEILPLAPAEWTPVRQVRESLADRLPLDEPRALFRLLRSLTDKGMIEIYRGQIRIRPAWREELERRAENGGR